MALTKYSYVKSVDLGRLTREIRDNATITVALDHLDSPSPGNVDIWFKAPLSTGEKTELDNLVTAHINTPLPKEEVSTVTVLEESLDTTRRTGGHFQTTTLDLNIPAGNPGDVTTMDFTWPIPISILAGEVLTGTEHIGDTINISVAPDTITGTVAEDVAAGVDNFRVVQTVLDNAWVGIELELTDFVNFDKVGRVLSIGYDNGSGFSSDRLLLETPTTNSFVAATPTYVRQTIFMVRNFQIPAAGRIEVGDSKIGGSYLPANTVFRVAYTNDGSSGKSFGFVIEYLY